jgi:hypothetical protein
MMFKMNDHTDDLRNTNWEYSDERMHLRAEVFRALKHHLDTHCRLVFEFCNDWVRQENKGTDNLEQHFQNYLRTVAERSYTLASIDNHP